MASSLPLYVVIDSTVLSRNLSLSGGELDSFERLVESGVVKVYVPEVVSRELISQRRDRVAGSIEALVRAADSSLRDVRLLGAATAAGELSGLSARATALIAQAQSDAEASLRAWFDRVGATVAGVAPDDGRAVLDSYFQGTPPFKAPKSRKDFPDAFIWQAVHRLANELGGVHLVTTDTGFEGACESSDVVTLHGSLRSFLESSEVRHAQNLGRQRREEALALRLARAVADRPEVVEGVLAHAVPCELDAHILDTSALAQAHGPFYVASVNDVTVEEVDPDEAIVLPGAVALIPVHFDAEIALDYWVERYSSADPYGEYPSHRDRSPTGETNAYMVEVQEGLTARGVAMITATLPYPDDVESSTDDELVDSAIIALDRVEEAAVADPDPY